MGQLNPMLFWTPLTFIVWTKLKHSLKYLPVPQKKVSHTALE